MLPLSKYAEKIPAGSMIIPLLVAVIINTVYPEFFTFGSYSSVLFSNQGMISLMCLTLLYTGCQLNIKDLPQAVKRGGSHVLFKYLAGAGFYFIVVHYFGYKGIFGVCALSILCSFTNCNSNLYMGLMEDYGDSIDLAARPLFNLNSGPLLSLITIGIAGMDGFHPIDIVSLLLPLFIGMLLSICDPNIREKTKPAIKLLTPVSGFIIGSNINLYNVYKAGIGGLLLVIILILVTAPVALFVDRILLKRPGYGGMATISVAGNAIAVPPIIAAAAPEFLPYVEIAMTQISAAVILTAIICPILVDRTSKRFGKDSLKTNIRKGEKEMKFFIDTANVDDIKKANDMGVICGVTTNPSLIAKEGRNFVDVIKEITSIVDGPISGEVKATTVDAQGMIDEGVEIAKIHPNMVVKIPMSVEGLKATKVLSEQGIKTNVTLIFSANQALLAARAGATYVSPFLGRLDDISQPGIDLIRDIAEIFRGYNLETEIIAASVRSPIHVTDCALMGANIATVPYEVIEQMTKHPLTNQGIIKFQKDYKDAFGE